MTETQEAGPVTEAAEPERKKIANRDWINDATEVVDEEAATGVRYEFLGRTKDGVTIPPDGKSYTMYFRDLSAPASAMLAGFGAVTLMGNVTNTWMGDKSDDKEASAADAIAARFALLNEGKWIDRTGAGVGARVDKDALAKAVVAVAAAANKALDETLIRLKLEENVEFVKTCRGVPDIARKYAELVGRTVKTVDDVFAALT